MIALTDPNYDGGCSPCDCSSAASGSSRQVVTLTPAVLTFAQPGRSYRVVCSWLSPAFVPFADSAGISSSKTSDWNRDDSLCNANQLGWTVYIPSNVGTAYQSVSLAITGQAKGDWTDATQFAPTCTWSVSAPIP